MQVTLPNGLTAWSISPEITEWEETNAARFMGKKDMQSTGIGHVEDEPSGVPIVRPIHGDTKADTIRKNYRKYRSHQLCYRHAVTVYLVTE